MQKDSKLYTREGLLKIIDALPISISLIDKNVRVTLANRSTLLFVNKKEEQLVGQVGGEAFGCLHSEDVPRGCGFGPECLKCKLRQTIMTTMETREPMEMVETTMSLKGMGLRHLRISTLPMVISREAVVLLSIEDITLAKTHERTQVEKEKLAAAVQTAGAVCHEVNQPLMVILGIAEMLLDEMDDTDTQKENLAEIQKQAERLGKITRKLMTLTQYKTKPYLNTSILDLDQAAP